MKSVIQQNSPNFLNEFRREIIKCIIKKSQFRTINNQYNQKIDINYNNFILIQKFNESVFLYFNVVDQFLYILKSFNKELNKFANY